MNSGDPKNRDERILDHVGRYRITLRGVLERLFFQDANCGNVLGRLMRESRVQSRRWAHGRVHYYQLTVPETIRRGLPIDRARPFGPRALRVHLALLAACLRPETRRQRLEDDEVKALFGETAAAVPHFAEGGKDARVFRAIVVGSTTRVPDLVKRLRAELNTGLANDTLEHWLSNRKYAYALLADSDGHCESLARAVERAGLRSTAHIIVERVPHWMSLREFLT